MLKVSNDRVFRWTISMSGTRDTIHWYLAGSDRELFVAKRTVWLVNNFWHRRNLLATFDVRRWERKAKARYEARVWRNKRNKGKEGERVDGLKKESGR